MLCSGAAYIGVNLRSAATVTSPHYQNATLSNFAIPKSSNFEFTVHVSASTLAGLDIPVNDVVSVCEIYCRANLEKKFESFS